MCFPLKNLQNAAIKDDNFPNKKNIFRLQNARFFTKKKPTKKVKNDKKRCRPEQQKQA